MNKTYEIGTEEIIQHWIEEGVREEEEIYLYEEKNSPLYRRLDY